MASLALDARAASPVTASGERIAEWLRHCPLLSHLDDESLADIAAQCRAIYCAAGHVLFQAGAPSKAFYLVVFGSVALHLPGPGGSEKLVDIQGAGGSFGQAAMFLGIPLPVTTRCLSDALILEVPGEAIFMLLGRDPMLARKMLAGMAFKLHALIHDIEGFAFRNAAGRLADYLLGLAPDADEDSVVLPASKGDIASKLLITRETLSRVIHQWEREGIVEIRQRRFVLKNREELSRLAKSPA